MQTTASGAIAAAGMSSHSDHDLDTELMLQFAQKDINMGLHKRAINKQVLIANKERVAKRIAAVTNLPGSETATSSSSSSSPSTFSTSACGVYPAATMTANELPNELLKKLETKLIKQNYKRKPIKRGREETETNLLSKQEIQQPSQKQKIVRLARNKDAAQAYRKRKKEQLIFLQERGKFLFFYI